MLSLSFDLKQQFSRAFPLTSGQQFDCSPRIHEISVYLYYTGMYGKESYGFKHEKGTLRYVLVRLHFHLTKKKL